MDWTQVIRKAIAYMEEHLTEGISAEDVAKEVYISPFYFQRGFHMLCGCTVAEYLRNRRLSLAAGELAEGRLKVIDAAMKYGYDSPDSFAKAFTRFHGVSPSMVQKNHLMMKTFAPLKIKILLEGGYLMEYKLSKKGRFTLLTAGPKAFSYEEAKDAIPGFWEEHCRNGRCRYVKGRFGVNRDEAMGSDTFEYAIADLYDPAQDIPEGYVTMEIPAFTWAVFPCKGALPDALQGVNEKIFSEWLPAMKEYEFAAGYCIELYGDAEKYENGIHDENYESEIWLPVRRKP